MFSVQCSESGVWTLEISSFPIRAIRLIRGSKSSHFLKFAFSATDAIHESKPYSMDLPERWGELGTTKPVKTESSDRHGRAKGTDPRPKSSCLLLVLFAAASYLLQRQRFVPHARGLWWNRTPRTSGKSSIYLEIFQKKILLLFFNSV